MFGIVHILPVSFDGNVFIAESVVSDENYVIFIEVFRRVLAIVKANLGTWLQELGKLFKPIIEQRSWQHKQIGSVCLIGLKAAIT